MNYPQTIEYLYSALPLYSRQGAAAYKKDLHNIRLLCAALGQPERAFPVIHVGGTNGKGSVSHMLAAIFGAAGYRTGLYTSPHLHDFRERIRIGGAMMKQEAVVSFVERIKPQIEKIEPSFFEITVAMAFDYFRAEGVEIAIVEVGLGGRLDSTNIVTPELSIITNIGMDHADLLGGTLQSIAGEKAGIIKPGVPAIIGERQAITDPVFEQQAASCGSPLFFAPDHILLTPDRLTPESLTVTYNRKQYSLGLTGSYQVTNAATVLLAVELMRQRGWRLPEEAVFTGLEGVKTLTGLGGRWEVLRRQPYLVLDVAHNEPGLQALLNHLEQLKESGYFEGRWHLILGTVQEKDRSRMLPQLPGEATYYFAQAHIPRALPASRLQEEAAAFGLHGGVYEEVNEAVQAALSVAMKDDLVLVLGSIFLVAEVDRNRF